MEFELENSLTSFEEHQFDTVSALFSNESDHMPSHYFSHGLKSNDFRIPVRREAISLIFRAQFSCNFDSIIPYLAISYVDRFISMQEIWNEGSSWIARLLAISCLSLAAKMKNTGLSISDLQRDEGFVCDSQSIRRMELLILTTLNWKLRSITPFSFLYFFISLFDLEDPPLIQGLRDRASEILFRSHYEIKILEYKPSIIAASALLCASQELFPLQFPCFRAAIVSCEHVNKEKLLNCSILMEETVMDRCKSTFDSVCNSTTPISVLDRICTLRPTLSSYRATPSDGGKSMASATIVRSRSLSSSNAMMQNFKEMDHQLGIEAPIANRKKINRSQPSSLNHFS